jgi:hypothetical protein
VLSQRHRRFPSQSGFPLGWRLGQGWGVFGPVEVGYPRYTRLKLTVRIAFLGMNCALAVCTVEINSQPKEGNSVINATSDDLSKASRQEKVEQEFSDLLGEIDDLQAKYERKRNAGELKSRISLLED